MQPKPPFSVRTNPESLEDFFVLKEGLPHWVQEPMWRFLNDRFYVRGRHGWHFALPFLDLLGGLTGHKLPRNQADLQRRFFGDDELFLDAVDFGLHWVSEERDARKDVEQLTLYLEHARSVYTIGKDDDGKYEIQYRQPPELTRLVEETTRGRDRSARHIREAWSSAFKRDANLNAAGAAAVKAVEVVAKPVIIPNNDRATLGQIIRAMRDKPAKWETDSEADRGFETVTEMMDQIWKGHYRHGDETKPFEASAAGTEMIVHLAVLVVHWFNSGKIRRVSSEASPSGQNQKAAGIL